MLRKYRSVTWNRWSIGSAKELNDSGNATTEFVMVSTMVMLFFLVVLQIAFALYTKNMLVDAATSGARYGTLHNNSAGEASQRTQQLINQSLPFGYPAEISVTTSSVNAVQVLHVSVSGPLPIVGPWGIPQTLTGNGQAVIQE